MPLYTSVYMCLVVTCWERADLWCLTVSLLLSYWYPGKVWYLIVSNPDLCTLIYFEIPSNTKRTNNMAESFHAHFNAHLYTTHPTIFVFLSRGQHTVVLYVVILLYEERKWSLPHMNDLYIRSFDCCLVAHCIHHHGMISAQP